MISSLNRLSSAQHSHYLLPYRYDQPDHIPGFHRLTEHQKLHFKNAFVGETETDIRWREEGFPAAVHELKVGD
jgi:hypothetical protein